MERSWLHPVTDPVLENVNCIGNNWIPLYPIAATM